MNDTYLVCEHCRQEFPFTVQDRQLNPALVDLHLRLHIDVCEHVDLIAAELIDEVEKALS